jgi:DNA-binding NtrC family response regulator
VDESERFGNVLRLPEAYAAFARIDHHQGRWNAAHARLARALEAAQGAAVWTTFARIEAATVAWHEGDLAAVERELERASISAELGRRWWWLPVVQAAVAAEAGAKPALDELVRRAAEIAELGATPAHAAQAAVVRAYAEAAEHAERGGERLREGAEAFMLLGHLDKAPALLRDAARFLARGGATAAAQRCVARARDILLRFGCEPGVARLDELEASFAGEPTRPRAPVLGTARSLDELGRLLRVTARSCGVRGSVRFFGLLDGAPRELGTLDEDTGQSGDLGARVEAALATGQTDESGSIALYPLRAGSLVACLAASRADPATPVLLEAAAVALALLEERREPLIASPAAAAPALAAIETLPSRHVELTVGPLELRHAFPSVIGRGSAMARALSLLDRLADVDAPALLVGETGTGKEVFARALHAASRRSAGPFVAVNCAAIPPTLFEAELFGHQRGAFTGALRDHPGYVRQAEGGTLFLDEIGELPSAMQPKLLRLLEDRRVHPVGGVRETIVDFRLVAATHRNLEAEVEAGRFRGDLYYRLNVVEIVLPPLRERSADLPALVRHLLHRLGRGDQRIDPKALACLLQYPWPGNVRELENELERAAILAGDGVITRRHLSPRVARPGATAGQAPRTLSEQMLAAERAMLLEALARSSGNRTHAARALGLTRQGLLRKLQRHGIGRARARG